MNESKNKTAVLVISAISDMKESNGSTVNQISKFIENEYEIPGKEYRRNLKKTLKKGVEFGALKKMGGRYQIGDVLKKLSTAKRGLARKAGKSRRRRSKSKRRSSGRRRRASRARSRGKSRHGRSRAARRRRSVAKVAVA